MSDGERTGVRDLRYSRWHRMASLRSLYDMPLQTAWELALIDLDNCEYCRYCNEPLALIETQVSKRDPKPATVTARLAHLAGIHAWTVSIEFDEHDVPVLFKTRQIEPPSTHVQAWSPQSYAYWLYAMRESHGCPRKRAEVS